jgi:hypothetical protein
LPDPTSEGLIKGYHPGKHESVVYELQLPQENQDKFTVCQINRLTMYHMKTKINCNLPDSHAVNLKLHFFVSSVHDSHVFFSLASRNSFFLAKLGIITNIRLYQSALS